jgi:hypothetical protein
MTKKIDPAIKGLGLVVRGMEETPEYMRRATVDFIFDKYILQPERDRLKRLKEESEKNTA